MGSRENLETICLCKTYTGTQHKTINGDECENECVLCKDERNRDTCIHQTPCDRVREDDSSPDLMVDSNAYSTDAVRRTRKASKQYRKTIGSQMMQRKANSASKTILVDGVTMRKVCVYRAHARLQPYSAQRTRKSIMKVQLHRVILIPNTKNVIFSNCRVNKLYKKTVTLQNVSNFPAKFQIKGRPNRSQFLVMIKSNNKRTNIIPAGMKLQLIIFFRSDNTDEPNELLVINVLYGRTVIIRLHAYRDPPILKVQEIEQPDSTIDELTCPPTERITISTDSWRTHMHHSYASQYSSEDSSDSSTISLPKSMAALRKRLSNSNFDCGKCFVGEYTCTVMKLQNVGYKGRFFIMSDIDWSSMHVEDVSGNNILTLLPFTIWPAYFSLGTDEELYLRMGFFPRTDGMHVSKLYILSDNCSLITTDVIGDGLLYESEFIQIDKALKKLNSPELYVDMDALYCINLEMDNENRTINKDISIANISEINIRFRWEKRSVRTEGKNANHLPEDFLNIQPSCGVFVPYTIHRFTVHADIANLELEEQYFTILQLFVEDIPIDALSEEVDLHTRLCKSSRRKCTVSVDVWVADIEVRLQQSYTDGDDGYERSKCDIDSHTFYDDDTCSFLSDIKCLSSNDEETGMIEFDSEISNNQPLLELTMDELFSNKDFIDLEKVESILMGYLLTAGVMRLSKNLYAGIKEVSTLTLTNKSVYPLFYEWGSPSGADDQKLNVSFVPKIGEILPDSSTTLKIILLPLKEGEIRYLYVPCYFGSSKNVLILGIECDITPFNVTFLFPAGGRPRSSGEHVTRVNWQADSLKVAFDLASRHPRYKALLYKHKLQEERELETVNLDEGFAHKDVATGPSEDNLELHQIGFYGFDTSFDINDGENDEQLEKSFSGSTDFANTAISTGTIVPFHKKTIPRSSKSVVIEFLNLNIGTVQKKKFDIVNETPVSSDVQLSVKNYFPNMNRTVRKENQERITSIYKKVYGSVYQEEEEMLSRVKRPNTGVVIVVCPSKAEISPFGRITIQISVFADTWGTYIDELIINITGLPRYTLGLCLQVLGSPISLSMPKNESTNAYTLRFGSIKPGNRSLGRNITVKNTSTVPIVINWHTFRIDPKKNELPFNLILDLYTPFTDLLAIHIRITKTATTQSFLTSDFKRYLPMESSRIMNSNETNPSSRRSTYTFSDLDSTVSSYEGTLDSDFPTISTNQMQNGVFANSTDYHDKLQQAVADTKLQLSIVPYYGVVDDQSCVVHPSETVIPPKQFAPVSISFRSESLPKCATGKLSYKILGFLRIAPMDKFRDYCYSREDGHFYPPVEIDLEANVMTPCLTYDISKSERTFTFSAADVMEHPDTILKMEKTFCFYNYDNDSINVNFEAHDPFEIRKISTYLEGLPPESMSDVYITGRSGVEVDITCTVNKKLVSVMLNDDAYQSSNGSKVVLKEFLLITHTNKTNQMIELILEIVLPLLNLSSHTLDFGRVYIGCEKTMILTIENATAFKQSFKIKKTHDNNNFAIFAEEGEIPNFGTKICRVAIKYTPSKSGKSIESLEISTALPNYMVCCMLSGIGTLDEKYYIPGV